MKTRFHLAIALLSLAIASCGQQTETGASPDEAAPEAQATASKEPGTLALVANGEDFVRQGFVTKDGWQVDFEHAYVTLSNVTAYQTDPAFDPDSSGELKASESVSLLEEPQTVDLAEGEADAEPITVTTQQAPSGNYNALAWSVVEANQGSAQGSTIVLEGTAQKDGATIDFTMNFDQPLAYTCGQYVGDERKGIVQGQGELETTFHFDHLFGDADAPADDALNQGAVGFEPFAALAQNGTLQVDEAMLKQESNENYQKLQEAILGLGHVGEGHCRMEDSVAQHDHE